MKPTPFGHKMLEHWLLDPGVTYLNHGTVGATPRPVLRAQRRLHEEIERQPSRFLLRELTSVVVGAPRPEPPRLRVAADRVARFLGARGDDLVFVDNATTGANAVLRSFPFAGGDELLVTDHGYGGVSNAARFVARERGITLRTVPIPWPLDGPQDVVEAIDRELGANTRLLVLDHIASDSALLLPAAAIIERCRRKNVRVLVDGAHAPGAIALDIPPIGADWYVANLHKWAFAPRSSGILWVDPERHTGLHPAVISWGLDDGLTAEFDLVGTRDPTPHLAAPAGLDFLEDLGVEAVQRYNHDLVWRGAQLLARRWQVSFTTPESMVATMASLPLPERLGETASDAAHVRDTLLDRDRIEVQVSAPQGARSGRLWVRVAAQVYNELADFERLAEAVERM